jgi:hypothetical protein
MARIDDSHHPFKRAGTLGPGPKKQKLAQEGNWECSKGKNTKTDYVQTCRWIGGGPPRKPMKVKRSKAKKKAYNKAYRAWLKRNARIKSFQAKPRKAGYRCRRTAVAKCR